MLNRAAAVLMVMFATNAFAADANDSVIRWGRRMADASELLKRGEHAAALEITDRTIHEMLDRLGSGDAATQIFGMVVSHKALALAGLGRKDDALWYWHSMITLYPALATSDVSMFGEAGAFLDANRKPRKPEPFPRNSGTPLTPRFTVPVLEKRVEPKFPRGARSSGAEGTLVVSVLITREGTITAPVVLEPLPAPTLSYAALEALRQWRYKPATRDGEPIEVRFDLSVTFKP